MLPENEHNYWVYITTNPNKSVLYTGVTNDLERRLSEHIWDNINERKSFAGKYFCYNLIFFEYYKYINNAIIREKQIKGWNRVKKVDLINNFNPKWRFLNDELKNRTRWEELLDLELKLIQPDLSHLGILKTEEQLEIEKQAKERILELNNRIKELQNN